MNASAMASAIISALQAEFGSDYLDPPDDHELSGYDQDTYWGRYWGAVCSAMVNYIQGNAKAVGSDTPTGDAHNLDIT